MFLETVCYIMKEKKKFLPDCNVKKRQVAYDISNTCYTSMSRDTCMSRWKKKDLTLYQTIPTFNDPTEGGF